MKIWHEVRKHHVGLIRTKNWHTVGKQWKYGYVGGFATRISWPRIVLSNSSGKWMTVFQNVQVLKVIVRKSWKTVWNKRVWVGTSSQNVGQKDLTFLHWCYRWNQFSKTNQWSEMGIWKLKIIVGLDLVKIKKIIKVSIEAHLQHKSTIARIYCMATLANYRVCMITCMRKGSISSVWS